ncbi:hypothetical protein [Ramlibacter sp.]|uniref:hypothetical protein n=1 Tax=Ramlibacter sp. TaxID=1917967 RepID=UPI002614B7D3|nr:hypothetical protein [Ramlibacter sp.]MDB5956034.1 hypothetical protein [Ramlibacter sp.]
MHTARANDMHTAICTFDDQARAEQAVASLMGAGFARHDLHIEHKGLGNPGPHSGTDGWDGMEREVAVDRGRLSSFMQFFGDLFSHVDLSEQVDAYSQHVQGGKYVVVVDTHDQADAERARTLLGGMEARDLNVVHRPALTPLRELVARRGEPGMAGMTERGSDSYEGAGTGSLAGERAMASNRISATAGPDLRDPEVEHAPGLRYADKDKPI